MTDHNARQAGLTDEQIEEIHDSIFGNVGFLPDAHRQFARAIEREVLAAHSADARNGEGVNSVLGPDEDGIPIERFSHRAHGMASHPNGTYVRYGEVERRIALLEKADG